jgi:3-oxoacyl-[acyl-carrier protein] reductase
MLPSGIGRATASRLLEAGARVVLFARRSVLLQSFVDEAGKSALAVDGDVADEPAIEKLFITTEKQFGPCDILINNAGMIDPDLVVDTSRERWDRMFAVNVTGTFLASRRALPSMMERRSGVIINTASISGVIGTEKFAGFVAYAAAKSAVIAMTEALAAEVRPYGIRVNAVSPGSVDTRMLEQANPSLAPDMTPDEVAKVILFLASEGSRPINGQNLHVYSA